MSQTLSQVARIGQLLEALTHAPKVAKEADEKIDAVITALDSVALPHTRGTANQLQEFQRETVRTTQAQSSMPTAQNAELATIAQTVIQSLHHEASQKHVTVHDSSAVGESLRLLPDRLPYLTDTQRHLHSEVVLCLECKAYRAAIVLAWSFAYDYIRHWVFSNSLAEFNKTLTTKYSTTKSGQQQPVYSPIGGYFDFWEARPSVGERTFLDTCESAGVVVGKPYASLVEFLRRRNDYAHPNFKTPDIDLTKGYIAELLSAITSEPFPKAS